MVDLKIKTCKACFRHRPLPNKHERSYDSSLPFTSLPFCDTDYTYSHTGSYMRHSDDLFNASESIITPIEGEAAASTATSAAASAAAVSNGVKSVQLQSSALTPGRGRAVQGGAWGKVEVKTRCV